MFSARAVLPMGKCPSRIAADVRRRRRRQEPRELKIIAGMLGVGLDELRRRDLQRRNRRLVWISAASLAGILVTTVLAGYALIARNEAEASRVSAEREAETARRTTEFMVGLFDVVDPGEARGRSVTAYEILERGVGQYPSRTRGPAAGTGNAACRPWERCSPVSACTNARWTFCSEALAGAGRIVDARHRASTEVALGRCAVPAWRLRLGAEQHYRGRFIDAPRQQPWNAERSRPRPTGSLTC